MQVIKQPEHGRTSTAKEHEPNLFLIIDLLSYAKFLELLAINRSSR